MPNLEEARAQAWQAFKRRLHSPEIAFDAVWVERGQYDEQRIAALVAAIGAFRVVLESAPPYAAPLSEDAGRFQADFARALNDLVNAHEPSMKDDTSD